MLIFKSKFGYYQTLCKSKTFDNEEIKYYMPVSFKKGYEPHEESLDIILNEWWLSCYKANDGTIKPKVFISNWKYVDANTKKKQEAIDKQNESIDATIDDVEDVYDNGFDLSSDNLPFY